MKKINYIGKFLACYVFCSTTHWFVSNLYTNFCTPASLSGILKTILLTQTPSCQILNYINTYSFSLMNQSITYALSFVMVNYTTRNKTIFEGAELT